MKKKFSKRARPALYVTMLWLTLGLFAVLSFALTLPYNRILTNVVLKESVLASGLLILMDFFEILAYAAGASLLLFAAFSRLSPAAVIRLGILYGITTVCRYLMELFGAWMLFGTRSFIYNFLEPTVISRLPYLGLDLAFVILTVSLSVIQANRYEHRKSILTKAATLSREDSPALSVPDDVFSFGRILSFRNPLQRCALILGCVLIAARVIDSLYFDLFTYLPAAISVEWTDILGMIGSYVYGFLIGVIFYLACILGLRLWLRRRGKLIQ